MRVDDDVFGINERRVGGGQGNKPMTRPLDYLKKKNIRIYT